MSIRFSCPHCGKRFKADDQHAGKLGRCPCGAKIEVPLNCTTLDSTLLEEKEKGSQRRSNRSKTVLWGSIFIVICLISSLFLWLSLQSLINKNPNSNQVQSSEIVETASKGQEMHMLSKNERSTQVRPNTPTKIDKSSQALDATSANKQMNGDDKKSKPRLPHYIPYKPMLAEENLELPALNWQDYTAETLNIVLDHYQTDPVSAYLAIVDFLESKVVDVVPTMTPLQKKYLTKMATMTRNDAINRLKTDMDYAIKTDNLRLATIVSYVATRIYLKGQDWPGEALGQIHTKITDESLRGLQDLHTKLNQRLSLNTLATEQLWELREVEGSKLPRRFITMKSLGGKIEAIYPQRGNTYICVYAKIKNISDKSDPPYVYWIIDQMTRYMYWIYGRKLENHDQTMNNISESSLKPYRLFCPKLLQVVSDNKLVVPCLAINFLSEKIGPIGPISLLDKISWPHQDQEFHLMSAVFEVPANSRSLKLRVLGASPVLIDFSYR